MYRAVSIAILVGLFAGSAHPVSASASPFVGGGSGSAVPLPGRNPRTVESFHIEISKDGVLAISGYLGVTLFTVTGSEPCNTHVLCETSAPANFLCSSGRITPDSVPTAADLAATIAAALTANCPNGTSATANGTVVSISSVAPGVRSCAFSDEMGSIDGFAFGLNVAEFGPTCGAHNVVDGTDGNEATTVAKTGGFSFSGASVSVAIPTVTTQQRLLVVLLLLGSGCGFVRRASHRRKAVRQRAGDPP